MEFAYCPNACDEIRRVQFFAVDKICHHPLVNCTDRAYTPSPSVSPSPSPSMPLPFDCVLCEFILKNAATMCMNQETANKRNVYQLCMEKTKRKEDVSKSVKVLLKYISNTLCKMRTLNWCFFFLGGRGGFAVYLSTNCVLSIFTNLM
jgi:hypothetical protein